MSHPLDPPLKWNFDVEIKWRLGGANERSFLPPLSISRVRWLIWVSEATLFPHVLHLFCQAAADLEPSADSSKDYDNDETDQLEAQDMKHDDSEDDDSNDGKRLPLNTL